MHREPGDREEEMELDDNDFVADEEFVEEDIPEETVVLPETANSDNVGDVSVEINVEELVAQVEAEHDGDTAKKAEVRRRLEEIYEDKDIEDTYALDFTED